MIIIISVPHQMPPRLFEFSSEQDLIDYVNFKDYAQTYDEALDALTHDWHTHFIIEDAADLERARNYKGHQWPKVQSIANTIVLPE